MSFRGALVIAVVAFAALLVSRVYAVEPMRVTRHSMEPTLQEGQTVLVEKLSRWTSDWSSGEVVALRSPEGDLQVKRIVAVGGQRVALRDGTLVVDGEARAESYATPDSIDSVYFGPVQVPAGSVFVMGDNRGHSVDSRSYGAVEEGRLIGRALAVAWPPSEVGLLGGGS